MHAKGKTPSWAPTSYRGRGRRDLDTGQEASRMPQAFLLCLCCDGPKATKIGAKSFDLGNPSTSLDVYPYPETLKYLIFNSKKKG